jgi:hypothetical protein
VDLPTYGLRGCRRRRQVGIRAQKGFFAFCSKEVKTNIRSPKRTGRSLKLELKVVEAHRKGNMLNREEIILTITLFLVLEVEEGEEVE